MQASIQIIMQHVPSSSQPWNLVNKYESLVPSVLANIVTVVVCLLCYDIYLILDEYFHTMVFSILVGAAIKPFKDLIIASIITTLYGRLNSDQPHSYGIVQSLKKSLIFESENTEIEGLKTEADEEKLEQQTSKSDRLGPPRKNSGEDPIDNVDKHKSAVKNRKSHKNHANSAKHVQISHFIKRTSIESEIQKKTQESDLSLTNVIFFMLQGQFFANAHNKTTSKFDKAKAKQRTFLRFTKQLFNIIAAGCFFYFLKGLTGLLILPSLFALDFLVSLIQKKFAHRLEPFVASLRQSLEDLVSRDKMQKVVSAMFSCCCIVALVLVFTASAIFSVYMIQRDFYKIKVGIEHSAVAQDFVNYTKQLNLTEIFNSSWVQSFQTGSVFDKINNLFESRANQITKSHRQCIRTVDSYSYNLIPSFITTRACVIYSELESSSIKNYLNYFGSLADIFRSVITFSFSQVFGMINYFFLFLFKAFIFFTTTYYIIEDFNIESSLMFVGKLFQRTEGAEGHRPEHFARDFVEEIKNIMLSSLFIAFSHFMLSWVMLDIFAITEFDFVASVVLGAMALVPVYRPWLGALAVTIGSYMAGYQHHPLVLVSFVIFYLLISNQIFAKAYASISVPSIFTNLSVILGIYSYGIIGVVYGPLILTIMKKISNAFQYH